MIAFILHMAINIQLKSSTHQIKTHQLAHRADIMAYPGMLVYKNSKLQLLNYPQEGSPVVPHTKREAWLEGERNNLLGRWRLNLHSLNNNSINSKIQWSAASESG